MENLLSTLPKDLDETYEKIFRNIQQSLAQKALLALKWITLARRPLFIEELSEACVLEASSIPTLEPETTRLKATTSSSFFMT
jgi:hypothetical protein